MRAIAFISILVVWWFTTAVNAWRERAAAEKYVVLLISALVLYFRLLEVKKRLILMMKNSIFYCIPCRRVVGWKYGRAWLCCGDERRQTMHTPTVSRLHVGRKNRRESTRHRTANKS